MDFLQVIGYFPLGGMGILLGKKKKKSSLLKPKPPQIEGKNIFN